MKSLPQVEANPRNARRSIGPTMEDGKNKSRQNAARHGLTAETVIDALKDYAAFEMVETSDYDVRTAVERELVLRWQAFYSGYDVPPLLKAGYS